jgi:nitrite reductase/ring-hydroxylating ferredoxin subunit
LNVAESWTRLCALADIPEGASKRIRLDSHSALALYKVAGRVYATADRCTHAGGSLSHGVLVDHTIECPLHGCRFNIVTGEALELPCSIAVRSYAVEVNGDDVFVRIGSGI